jgi:hypothetical protein
MTGIACLAGACIHGKMPHFHDKKCSFDSLPGLSHKISIRNKNSYLYKSSAVFLVLTVRCRSFLIS